MGAVRDTVLDLKRARLINRVVADYVGPFGAAESAYALRTIREAKRNDLPLSWLLAMIEQETGWRNIFGCDHGEERAYCHQRVTNAKVGSLRKSGLNNGVGYTQLTSPSYVDRARRRVGGAASPRNQIIVGAQVLKEKAGGDVSKAWRYNGDPAYQNQIEPRAKRWHQRFRAAGLA